MLYQRTLHTTVLQRIRHNDPYAAAEHERLEDRATRSAANHDHTGSCKKAPLYAGQTVSVINNDRTLWLPAMVVRAANHGSYIKVVGGAEYRRARDHICEHRPDAVKPDTSTKVEVAGQPGTTPSTSEAVQQIPAQRAPTAPAAQLSVAPATPKQAAARSLQQQPAPSGRHLLLQMCNNRPAELLSHLADQVVSVRHHNALLNRCKYNHDDVTG